MAGSRAANLTAARQLDCGGRLALSGDTMSHLRRVMDDIYTKAKLTGAGRCTTASALTRESAVVRCGTGRVVVQAPHHTDENLSVRR